MKKIKRILICLLLVLSIVSISSCKKHEHTFEEKYTYNETEHWRKATCKHKDEVTDKGPHTFDKWILVSEATEESFGKETRTCTVCGYVEERMIQKIAHTHTFSDSWSSDDNYHWHAATCGDLVVSDKAAHTYGDFIIDKQASVTEDGSKHRTCSVCGHVDTVSIPKNGSSNNDNNNDNNDVIVTSSIYTGTYYNSVTDSMLNDATTLKSTLNTIINKDYKRYSYSSAQTQLKTIDSYDDYYIECLYTGERLEKNDAWDREHVWAKSYGFKDEAYDAYSDMHHLRVSEHTINNFRSSSYFDVVSNPEKTDSYGNRWTTTVFEPRNEVKGDIARMLFYMTVKYDDPEKLDLELTDDVGKINASASVFGGYAPSTLSETEKAKRKYIGGTSDPTAYLGMLSTLLKWHYEDPVDAREMSRNNKIYEKQKNRNPFIDHPEYAYYLYKTESSQFINVNDLSTYANTYQNYNAKAIADINAKIKSIGTVTLNSKELLDEIQTDYDNLGEVSKSFVTGYHDFLVSKNKYQKMYDLENRDTSVETSFSFIGVTNTSGTKLARGIDISYTSSDIDANAGIYAQIDKNQKQTNVVITANDLYSTIKYIKFTWDNNNTDGTATVVVSSSTSTNTINVSKNVKKKNSTSEYVDISSLLVNGEYGSLTITVKNDATTSSSVRISAIAFTLTK